MANVCCPIELEPRTLKGGQINHAREIAADAAKRMEAHEATIMFFEGLRPVGSRKKMKQIIEDEEEEEEGQEDQVIHEFMKNAQIIEMPCQCTCSTAATTASTESRELDNKLITEPLSAPF